MMYEIKQGTKQDIEHMIKVRQPILVSEFEGKLIPYYLKDLSPYDITTIVESSKPLDWKNILSKPYDCPSFDLKDFDKIHQDTIYHMNITLNTSDALREAVQVLLGIDMRDRSDIHKAYRHVIEIFYYSAQSDAIGLRQRLGRDDTTLVLYSPSIVEIVDGTSNDTQHSVDMQDIVLKNKKPRLKPELDIYISRF